MKVKVNSSNKLAIKMAIALILGLIVGIGCIVLRENLSNSGNSHIWTTIKIFYSKIFQKMEQKML